MGRTGVMLVVAAAIFGAWAAGCGAHAVRHRQFVAVPSTVAQYSARGAYLDAASKPPFSQNPRIRFDRHGIPVVAEPNGYQHNAVTIAQWGLRGESVWLLRHDRAGRRDADRWNRYVARPGDPP